MEHLLLPQGAIIEAHERVPCVAVDYDGGSFLSYPDRHPDGALFHKLHPDQIRFMTSDPFTETERRRLESLLQTWLFFGLLFELLGDAFRPSEFIDGEGTHAKLNTFHLNDRLDAWSKSMQGSKDPRCLIRYNEIYPSVKRAWHVLRLPNTNTNAGLNPLIVASLFAVGETICTAVVATLKPSVLGVAEINGWFPWPALQAQLKLRMIENGCCPADADKWQASITSFESFVYLSKMSYPLKNHSACAGRKFCLATQHGMSPAATTVHRCESADCEFVKVDIHAVQAILDAGEIAVLDISETAHGISIDVVAATGRSYAAISHVWAEGLGNPVDNALPTCQLRHLANVFYKFKFSAVNQWLHIWLDTLCCPVNSERHRQYCISQMARVYKDAEQVLVISASLENLSPSLSDLDLLARFAFSPWYTRLWTLQEGALAQRLWLQLADTAVDMDMVEELLKKRSWATWQHLGLYRAVLSAYSLLRKLLQPLKFELGSKSLVSLVRAIKHRAVTVPTDEGICLFTCMGLPGERLGCEPAKRMREFWKAMGEAGRALPYGAILFRGDRLQDVGYRWAPATLMAPTQYMRLMYDHAAKVMAHIYPQGLVFHASAVQVRSPAAMLHRDAAFWQVVLQDLEGVRSVRIRENCWRLIVVDRDAKDEVLEARLADIYRSREGVILLLENQTLEISETAVLAATSMKAGEVNWIRTGGLQLLGLTDDKFSKFLEYTHRLSQDETIDPLLPLLAEWDPDQDVSGVELVNERVLARLPPVLKDRLLSIARSALQDPVLQACLPRPGDREETDIAAAIVHSLAGKCLEIVQTWPAEQIWCLD